MTLLASSQFSAHGFTRPIVETKPPESNRASERFSEVEGHHPIMYGSLVFPSVVFSKDGRRIYPDDVKEPMTDMIYSSCLGSQIVRFYKDGFVSVDSPTKEEAMERLNCFLLCLRLLRLATRYVPALNPDELFTIKRNELLKNVSRSTEQQEKSLNGEEAVPVDAGTEFSIDSGTYTSFRAVFMMHGDWRKDFTPLININASELEVIVELANRLFGSEMRAQLLTFGEAWTFRDKTDWNTGFILSWMCIESMVFNQIRATYGSEAIYVRNKKGLIDTFPVWKRKELSTHAAIDKLKNGLIDGTLSFPSGDPTAFDETYFDLIQGIREIRNEIIHGGRRATRKELEECFGASTRALWRLMRLGGIEDYSNYLARMQEKRSETEVKLPDGLIQST